MDTQAQFKRLADFCAFAERCADLNDVLRGAAECAATTIEGGHVFFVLADEEHWPGGWATSSAENAAVLVVPIPTGHRCPPRLVLAPPPGPELGRETKIFLTTLAGIAALALARLDPDEVMRSADGVAHNETPDLGRAFSRELTHRIRNLLSIMRVIARRTADRSTSVEEYSAQLDGRISALARVQTSMITSLGASADLETLVADEMLAFSVKDGQVRARGPKVPLRGNAAEALALAVHELTENAIKYGALSVKSGAVDVIWSVDRRASPPLLLFDWTETGVPIIARAPRIRGFGHELIEQTLPYELSATSSIDFRPGGFRCALRIPLPAHGPMSNIVLGAPS